MRPEHQANRDTAVAGEVDIWWGGYAGRTMLPSFVGCVLLTALIALIGWRLYVLGYSPGLVRYSCYGLAGTLWLIQLGLWLHRSIAITYRLTTRRFYRDQGFSRARFDAIELAAIADIEVKQDQLERWLGVGRVRLHVPTNGRRPLVLWGVSDPARLVKELRRAQRRLLERDGQPDSRS